MDIDPANIPLFSKVRAILGRATTSGEDEARALLESCGFIDAIIGGLSHQQRLKAMQPPVMNPPPAENPTA